MNTRLIVGALAAIFVLTAAIGVGFTEDKPAEKPKPMSEAEMWAAMQKLAEPSAMHKDVLTKLVGTWEAKGKIFTGMGEMPIQGKSVNKAIMGGRFIQVNYAGPFMGGEFEGAAFVGYDNLSKSFQQTWIMTMATNMDNLTGSWDATTKTLTWRGVAHMPGGVTYKKRTTACFKTDDTIFEESFATGPDGKEAKEMELTYTRVKQSD